MKNSVKLNIPGPCKHHSAKEDPEIIEQIGIRGVCRKCGYSIWLVNGYWSCDMDLEAKYQFDRLRKRQFGPIIQFTQGSDWKENIFNSLTVDQVRELILYLSDRLESEATNSGTPEGKDDV